VTDGGPFLLPLRGPVKNYAWGSRIVLARLAGRPTPTPLPEAELWLGAHPQGPAEIGRDEEWTSLRDAIDRAPVELLGRDSLERFGVELPFLLKVLAIEQPLSVQVHPDRAQAAAGFRRERAAGRSPEQGSYCDPRHKPELIVAIEPLWVLRGLLAPDEIRRRFLDAGIASLGAETDRLARRGVEGLPDFVATLLGVAGDARRRLLTEASGTAQRARRAGLGREHPLYWLARLVELYPNDPLVLAPLLMHLVRLSPGQGIFQPPRMLHSYLEGAGVEVMASSDNVVRAGLTPKPIDVLELLAVADLTPSLPSPIEPLADPEAGIARFAAPADEFVLLRLEAGPAREVAVEGPTAILIGICTRGRGSLAAGDRGESLDLESGSAFAVRPGAGWLRMIGDLCVYAATVRAD
jgi:mannose-6-phosphate isomerase